MILSDDEEGKREKKCRKKNIMDIKNSGEGASNSDLNMRLGHTS